LEDLRHVCAFLEGFEEWNVLGKFAKRGVRMFPQVASFHWCTAVAELAKRSGDRNRERILDQLRQTIKLASTSSDPRDEEAARRAKRCLDVWEGAPRQFDTYGDEDDWYDDDADEYEEGPWGGDGPDGMSAAELRDIVEAACERYGIDPEEAFAKMEELRFGGAGEARAKRRGRKRAGK
jgi:hypothetical protein